MSYKKKTVTVTGHSRGNTEIEGGSFMLMEIDRHDTLHNDTEKMPFHALDYAEVESSVVDKANKDAYGCDDGNGANGSKVGKAKVCEGCIGGD